MTRKTFLVAAGCAVLAVLLGRRWNLADGRASSAGAARPRRAENLVERAYGPGVELRPSPVDPRGPVFRLNRSGALVWRNVDGRRTVDELATLLGSTYGLTSTAAQRDTMECLRTLESMGLVNGLPPAGRAAGPAPS